jgi:hypothetical protein
MWAKCHVCGVILEANLTGSRFTMPSEDSMSSPVSHKLGHLEPGHPANCRDFSPHHPFTMDPKETAIALAICDLETGVYTSQRTAAAAYGVPRTTLQDRLKGVTKKTSSH